MQVNKPLAKSINTPCWSKNILSSDSSQRYACFKSRIPYFFIAAHSFALVVT
nr:MAG TPA: hypothetical protein [Caudoviricetes sp.]